VSHFIPEEQAMQSKSATQVETLTRAEAPGVDHSVARAEVFVGTVADVDSVGGTGVAAVTILLGGRAVEGRRAASCLLEPACGDRVLVSIHDGMAHVLSILDRAETGRHKVELGGGIALSVEEGELSVLGAKAVRVSATEKMSLAAPRLEVRADDASLVVKSAELLGRFVESSFHHVKTFARTVESVADDVTAVMKRSVRLVSEMDQTRARHVDVRAEGTVVLHGENTAVTARRVTKIDSDQVHIG
jgi:hypothetical protein